MKHSLGFFKKGNSVRYSLKCVRKLEKSPLKGKNFIFLGSSVTLGAAAHNTSFVDYLVKRDGIHAIKEAVSGTTLVDTDENSYIRRLVHNLDKDYAVDCFVCQLSTNDAARNLALGEISASKSYQDFDISTITGAMEYIIGYAKQAWKCPVIFYTGAYFENVNYRAMVERLLELQKKWDIGVIDLWNNKEMKEIDTATRKLYMNDDVHPLMAGYLEWWTPVMEEYLYQFL